MKNPFSKRGETKSYDVMPEGLWSQFVAAQDMRGGAIGLESAVGLPALLAVLRFLSHSAGLVPLNVIRDGSVRERATDTWQWRLLHRRPGPAPMTPFHFNADLAVNFAGRGNAYVRKLKPSRVTPRFSGGTPRVSELLPLNAGQVQVKRADDGSVIYVDSTGSRPVERGTDEIIHIRSFAISRDGLTGVSPITQARQFVEAGLRRQQFEASHLANGVNPSLAVKFSRGTTEDQAKRWLDFLESRHTGSAKAGKIIGLSDGNEITPLPVSLADAQFADMTRLTLEQACAMYQVPPACLLFGRQSATDDDYRHFSIYGCGPFLTAEAQAFEADDDLFRPGEDDDLSVSPDADALLKMDALKKAQVQREQIQTGTRTADELRNEDGYGDLPPLPDDWTQSPGKIPQITPVGGKPNPTVDTTPGNTP
jgi:HK97 family phage portal protein